MGNEVKITKKEVIERPNDFDLGSYVRSKMDEDDYEYDRCVICGKFTPYLTTTNINFRVGYVEGAGQGCYQPKKCNYDYDPI